MPVDLFDSSVNGGGAKDLFAISGVNPAKQNSGIIGDTVTDLKRGVEQLPGAITGIADIVNPLTYTNNRRYFDEAADWAGKQTGFQPSQWSKDAAAEYSPERQASDEAINKAWESGDPLDIAEAYATNPRSALGVVAQSAPSMVGGGVIARGAMKGMAKLAGTDLAALSKAAQLEASTTGPASTALNRMATTASGIGEGAITAGQNMDQVSRDIDPRTAAWTSGLAGTITGTIGKVSGRIANKLGLPDVETAMAGGGLGKSGLPWYTRIPSSAVQEGLLQEFPQSAQEQIWQNVAEGKPWHEGVARQAIEGAIAGAAMGGAVATVPHGGNAHSDTTRIETTVPRDVLSGQMAAQPPSAPAVEPTLPAAGPLSAAVNVGIASGATTLRPAGTFSQVDEFANLLNSEKTDKEARVQQLLDTQALQQMSDTESADARVEGQRLQETAQARNAILHDVLDNLPDGQNPARAFDRALRASGFASTEFSPSEKRTLELFRTLVPANAPPEVIPSTTNELDAQSAGIKERSDKGPSGVQNPPGFKQQQERAKRIAEKRAKMDAIIAQRRAAKPVQEFGPQPTNTTPLNQTPTHLPIQGINNVPQAVEAKQTEAQGPQAPDTEGEHTPGADAGNGFKHGSTPGERYRVGAIASVGGAVSLEKRYPAGTAATFYVGNDGNLIDADSVNLVDGASRSRLWIPKDKQQSDQAVALLDEMGQLALDDPKRAELKARLKALVTGADQAPPGGAPAKPRTEKEARQQREEKNGTQATEAKQTEAQGPQQQSADVIPTSKESLTVQRTLHERVAESRRKKESVRAERLAKLEAIREKRKSAGQRTANTAERNLTAVTAVPDQGDSAISKASNGSNGSTAAADSFPVKDYPKGQATALAARMTKQGLPSEVVPHPSVQGAFAIVPAGQKTELSVPSEPAKEQDLIAEIEQASQKPPASNAKASEQAQENSAIATAKEAPNQPINARLNMRPTVATKDILTPAGAITAAAMKGKGSVWFHQGDPNHIQFRAKVTFSGQPASPEAVAEWERLQKAQELGYRLTNRRAGSYGTVWTLERNNETLTKDGFASINDPLFDKPMRESAGPGYDNMVSGQATYARKLAEWFATLPESTLRSASALATKINNTPIGEWASIQRDRTGQVRMDFEDTSGKLDLHMFSNGEYLDQVRHIVTLAGEAKNKGDREWFQVASAAGKKAEEAIASDSDIHDLLREYGFEDAATEQPAPQSAQDPESTPATIEKAETEMTPDWDSFAEFWNGMIEGKGTIDDVKKSFALLVDEADAFRATIAKMKNDQLKRMLGWSARPDDKKADLVRKVYDQTLERFTLNKSAPSKQWTYGEKMEVVEKRYQDQLRAVIDSLTDADLAEFRDSIAENSKARKEALEQKKAAAADPKTLEDFEVYATYSKNTGKTADEARKALTPEQRAAWDSLLAEKSRTARQDSSAQQKAEVKVAAVTTEGQIIETKHTKTGEDLFVVKAAERVERDVYNQWNATAKKLGGWYSSFRGNGAVPGFQFKTRENAQAFLKFLGGDVSEAKESVQERRDAFEDDKSQSAVDRLNDMADRLDERADESLGRDRKANTDRRARFAAAAEASAQSDKALAKTMRNIAKAIQDGTAKLLDRVRQKTQVEMLQEFVRNAKDAELRSKYPAYIDQERHKGEPADIDTAEFAQWPTYSAERSDLANLARQLLETDGTKKLGQQLLKIADDITAEYKKFAKENLHKVSVFKASREGSAEKTEAVFSTQDAAERAIARSGYNGKATTISFKRGEHLVIMGPTMARERGVWQGDDNKRITLAPDSGELLVEKLGKMARTNRDAPRIPWQFENAYGKRKRLAAIGIETPAEFRSALREFIGLREQAKAPDRVKELERSMIGRKNDGLDFFPTPKNVAQQMIDAAELKEWMSVLEPSAGWGHIAEMIRDSGVDPDVIELSGDRRELLEAKGFNVVGSDFIEATGQYDRILMNPPFSDRRDAQHVQHAYSLLRPGGRLVAIMGEGVFFGQDKKAEAFRNWLEEVGGTSEKLEEGSFLDPSLPVNTGVNARMVVIDKPAGQAAPVDTENTGPGSQANDGRITPADKAIYGMAAEGKSTAEILNFIASASRNPFYRQLAKLLLKTGIAPKITVGDSKGWKMNAGEGHKYAAAYNPKTDTVALFRPSAAERNMLHELVHAATIKALEKGGLSAAQMRALYQHVKKTGKLHGMYGMTDVDEFVTEAFTNPKFQEALKKVMAPQAGGKLSSAWQWFVRVVRGILGLHAGQENALSAALEIGVGVMRENMKVSGAGGNVRYATGPKQADSEAFRKWFGDSKVVDAEGNPLVVYHGTASDFSTFSAGKLGEKTGGADARGGFFFAANPDAADQFTWENGEKTGSIMPVYLSIRNPARGSTRLDGSNGRAAAREIEAAKAAGSDGIVFHSDMLGHKGDTWVAFRPEQIKSAIGNNGEFDPSNPDIRYNVIEDAKQRVPPAIQSIVSNAFTSNESTSWLTPFNTQFHKAQKWAAEGKTAFKKVFDLGQQFIGDTSRYGVMAQNAAPTLFHEIKSPGDLARVIKSAKSFSDISGKTHTKDIEAIASPLYDGTLYGGASPLAGVIFSDEQLRSEYKLNDAQIKLYHEALAAVNVSMDEMAKSIIAKHAKNNEIGFDREMSIDDMSSDVIQSLEDKKEQVLESVGASAEEAVQAAASDMDDEKGAKKLRADFEKEKESAQNSVARIEKTIEDINGIVDKNKALQAAGYFPLMRFGENTVTAKDEDGNVQFYGMYEDNIIPKSGRYEANKVASEIRAMHPEWTVTTGIHNTEKYRLYKGMNMEAVKLFAEHMDAESLEPFQEYLRQATNNHSVLKRLVHRKGTPGFDRDVRRTLAQFIVSNARATSSNYNLFDMRKAAEEADTDGGDVGKEAVKLYRYVAEPEEEAHALRGFLFFNYLGGSLASAMINLTQVPLMTFPFLSKYSGAKDIAHLLLRSARLAIGDPQKMSSKLGEALRKAELDGVTAPQEIHQLRATAMNTLFSGNRAANLLFKTWGAPFAIAEAFNRRTTFIAAYQLAENMSAKELKAAGSKSAFDFAENAVNETQGIYNKGNRMNVGRGAVGATLMTFKQFSIMYLELLKRLPYKQRLMMIGLLMLSAGGGGLPFADDAEDIIDTIGQWLGYGTNSKKALRNATESMLGKKGADITINGLASQMGIDLHSRFGMQNLIPGSSILKQSTVDKGRDIQEFFGPAAGVVKSIGDALENLATGKPGRAALSVAPNAVGNAVKGYKMLTTGYGEDSKERRTVPVNAVESVAKGIGFNPKSVADYSAIKSDIYQDEKMVQVKREEFTSAMADAILSEDIEARNKALSDMAKWNRENPKLLVSVSPLSVMQRVRAAKMEGVDRFIKSIPRAMKQSAMAELRP